MSDLRTLSVLSTQSVLAEEEAKLKYLLEIEGEERLVDAYNRLNEGAGIPCCVQDLRHGR